MATTITLDTVKAIADRSLVKGAEALRLKNLTEMHLAYVMCSDDTAAGAFTTDSRWLKAVEKKAVALRIAGHGVKPSTPTAKVGDFQSLVKKLAGTRVGTAAEHAAVDAAVVTYLTTNPGDFAGAAKMVKTAKAVKVADTVADTVTTLAAMPAASWSAADIRRVEKLLTIARAAKATSKSAPKAAPKAAAAKATESWSLAI